MFVESRNGSMGAVTNTPCRAVGCFLGDVLYQYVVDIDRQVWAVLFNRGYGSR